MRRKSLLSSKSSIQPRKSSNATEKNLRLKFVFLGAQQLARHSRRRLSVLIDLFFGLVLQLVELIEGQKILGGDDAKFFQPFGLHVQAARADAHAAGKNLLAVVAQQPIDENSGRVRMRLILEHREMAVAAADVQSLFGHRQWNHREICLDKRIEFRIADARSDGDFTLGQILREQTQIPRDKKLLGDQSFQKLFALKLFVTRDLRLLAENLAKGKI